MGSDEKERQKEMQKLYDAIGYSENDVITPYPKEVRSIFFLKMLRYVVDLKCLIIYPSFFSMFHLFWNPNFKNCSSV